MALSSDISDLSNEENNFDEKIEKINAGIRRAKNEEDSEDSTS